MSKMKNNKRRGVSPPRWLSHHLLHKLPCHIEYVEKVFPPYRLFNFGHQYSPTVVKLYESLFKYFHTQIG